MDNAFIIFLFGIILLGCSNQNFDPLAEAEERYPMLKRCSLDGSEEVILCGTLEVYENREERGKKIPINVYLFPSYNPNLNGEVFTEYTGGPGYPNTAFNSYYLNGGYSHILRELQDILIIDNRGTGATKIQCDEISPPNFIFESSNPDRINECYQEINKTVATENYNTNATADDLEEVRNWLGINKLDLHGLSYGTRMVLEYSRRYPTAVNSLILSGPVPPNFGYLRHLETQIDQRIKHIVARCERDSLCNVRFPDFSKQLEGLPIKLKAQPAKSQFVIDSTKTIELEISEEIFLQMVGYFVYDDLDEKLPLYIDEAYKGNFQPLLEANRYENNGTTALFMSTFCHEEIRRYPLDTLRLSQTYTKGILSKAEYEVCNHWKYQEAPNWLSEPLDIKAPVLILTGELDIPTPPAMGEQLATLLPNVKHLVFPNQGHHWTDYSCWDELVYEFLKTSDLSLLTSECFNRIERPKFKIRLE